MNNLYESKALQHEAEIAKFINLLQRENVHSYLEIGSKFGGSLWRIGNALPQGSIIVSVDLPSEDKTKILTQPHLQACVDALVGRGYDAHLIIGDSTQTSIVEAVRAKAPFDAVLIDGNHHALFVNADWKNYGPMARIVAFHDIAWRRPKEWTRGYRIDVRNFWESIKGDYRHEEIKLDPTGQDNGIGVLWH